MSAAAKEIIEAAVTLQGANEGDTSTIEGTLEAAEANLAGAREHADDDSNDDWFNSRSSSIHRDASCSLPIPSK